MMVAFGANGDANHDHPVAVTLGWPQRLDLRAHDAAAAANDPAKAFAQWSA